MRICLTTGSLVDGKDRFLGGVPDLHCLGLRLAPLLLLLLFLLLLLLLLLQLQLKWSRLQSSCLRRTPSFNICRSSVNLRVSIRLWWERVWSPEPTSSLRSSFSFFWLLQVYTIQYTCLHHHHGFQIFKVNRKGLHQCSACNLVFAIHKDLLSYFLCIWPNTENNLQGFFKIILILLWLMFRGRRGNKDKHYMYDLYA